MKTNDLKIKIGMAVLIVVGVLFGSIAANQPNDAHNVGALEQFQEDQVQELELIQNGVVVTATQNEYDFSVVDFKLNKTDNHIDSAQVTIFEKNTGVEKVIVVGERYAVLPTEQVIAVAIRDVILFLDAQPVMKISEDNASANSADININHEGEIEVTL